VGNIVTVTDVTHTLNMRDISRALFRWTTDNRNDWVKNNIDIHINQQHNCALLLDSTFNPISESLFQLNGFNRFDRRPGDYFNYVQPWEHHSNTPADGINMYSFSLRPEEHQPTGTSNLTRIDQAVLILAFTDTTAPVLGSNTSFTHDFLNAESKLYVYAKSYNVIRFFSGLAGLAYNY